jgi:multimeric flavodoxin WrbA
MRRCLLLLILMLTSGCVNTAVAIVKAPFQLAGAAVDGLTTSQEEADRNRGRRERKAEERAEEQAERDAEKAEKRSRQAQKDAREAEKERRKAEKRARDWSERE